MDFSATDHGGNRGSLQRVRGAAVYGGIFGVSAVGFLGLFRVPPVVPE